jgi:hypothetical protein
MAAQKKANCEDSQPHLKQIADGSIILPLIGRLTDGNEIQILFVLPLQILCLCNIGSTNNLSNTSQGWISTILYFLQ